MLFLIPGMRETLRVNGQMALNDDPQLLSVLPTGGRPAAVALVLTVEEAYLHCGKALIRSALWNPESWPAADGLPSAAEILSDHAGLGDLTSSAASLEESYKHRL
jgi:predicted pyridoxine 5'-phosphate oxidase superfamily flavin-nucleotide-binding protein